MALPLEQPLLTVQSRHATVGHQPPGAAGGREQDGFSGQQHRAAKPASPAWGAAGLLGPASGLQAALGTS